MIAESKNNILYLSGIRELTAVTAIDIKKQLVSVFLPELINLECDCTSLEFIDSSGLGALISMQKLANERGGKLRLISPRPNVIQILELTRLHRLFEIIDQN